MAKSVLVVEPQLTLKSLWESVLRDAGFYVRGVTDGLSALAAMQIEPVNLVIVDVRIRDVDGYRLCGAARKLSDNNKVPVIVVTDDNLLMAQTKAHAAGAQEVMRLPTNHREAAKFIADLPLTCHRLLASAPPG